MKKDDENPEQPSVVPQVEQPTLEPHGESTIKLPSGTDTQLKTTPAHPEGKPGNAHPESPVNEPIVPNKSPGQGSGTTGKDLSDKVYQATKDARPGNVPDSPFAGQPGKRVSVSELPDFQYNEQDGSLLEEEEFRGKIRFDDGHEFWIQKRHYK